MKKVVFTFGRFNPPTTGHAKLINKVIDYAHQHGAENRIYTSFSHDNKKNPLPYKTKIQFLKKLFPKAHVIDDPKAVSAFHIASILSNEGYTDVTMVVGDDRVEGFDKDIRKYIKSRNDPHFDPKKHYAFDSWKVISAGRRDPNASGVEGVSGTKMREYIKANDMKSFSQAIPTKNARLARDIFNVVKQNLKEEAMINEGVNDPGIFKAVFLAGGPGSGKDFIVHKVLSGHGFVEINSDKAFEFLLKKNNLDMKMPANQEGERNVVRGRAKEMTVKKEELALNGRLGLIINGTADDAEKISRIKNGLESMGYHTMMVFVNTSDEVSKSRNIKRGEGGGRMVPETIRSEKWKSVQKNLGHMQQLFGNNFLMVDNSDDIRTVEPTRKHQIENALTNAFKKVQKFVKTPVSHIASKWVNKKAAEISGPNIKETDAHKEAMRLGLEYYGFGRYGKNGHTLYKVVNGQLQKVLQKEEKEIILKKQIVDKYKDKKSKSPKNITYGTVPNGDAYNATMPGLGRGTSVTEEQLPNNKSVRKWATKPEIVEMYKAKYGNNYPEMLINAAYKLHESLQNKQIVNRTKTLKEIRG